MRRIEVHPPGTRNRGPAPQFKLKINRPRSDKSEESSRNSREVSRLRRHERVEIAHERLKELFGKNLP